MTKFFRQKQATKLEDVEPLLKLPCFIVSQPLATSPLLQKFLILTWNPRYPVEGQEGPLVLAFAGLSGHCKTEMARHLG